MVSSIIPAPPLDYTDRLTIQQALYASGYSVTEVATKAGLHRSTVMNTLKGVRATNVESAHRIADALEIDVNQLRWPVYLTTVGRRPCTGGSYTKSGTYSGSTTSNRQTAPEYKESSTIRPSSTRTTVPVSYCSTLACGLQLSLTGVCDMCGA